MVRIITAIIMLFLSTACLGQPLSQGKDNFVFGGRYKLMDGGVELIGSGSYAGFWFKGDNCTITLQSIDTWEHHNYVSIEIDGKYAGRLKVEAGPARAYNISVPSATGEHSVVIFKATEAANGSVVFTSTNAVTTSVPEYKSIGSIEFIGNSITCGMGNDLSDIGCNQGEWFDQHNAYWAYGPILARAIQADFILSSVSGIGMYRNWNDENILEPNMPQVYNDLYLRDDSTTAFNTRIHPDIVTICLGTNDLSDGDGVKPRLPFNAAKFTSNYIAFVKMIYGRYPNARIVLLNSPMLSGTRNHLLITCLQQVISHFSDEKGPLVTYFEFQPMQPGGCGSHPDIDDHKQMAAQLGPYLKKIIDEN